MKFEKSPEYEAEMEACRRKREAKETRGRKEYGAAKKKWLAAGGGWLPMEDCPLQALDDRYGLKGAILVSDGAKRALATVRARFGTPIFYKVQPEMVWRDGFPCLVGGERDPRDDLPAWWWKWELTDEFGNMTYAGGEETGKDEVDFVPTHWTFLADAPTEPQPGCSEP